MRAASSKGAADLIVLWEASWLDVTRGVNPSVTQVEAVPEAWLVQCKRDGKLPKAERETLIDLAGQTGALPVLARVPKSGRGVEFIDLRTGDAL